MTDRAPDDETLRGGDVDPRTLLDAAMVAELIVDIRRLARGVETFANELVATNSRVEELRSLRRRNGILATALALGVLMGLIGTWAFLGRLNEATETAQTTNRLIAECTAPAPPPEEAIDENDLVHECYDAARARSALNVENLDRAAIDAAVCAVSTINGRPEDVEACYDARRDARPNVTIP